MADILLEHILRAKTESVAASTPEKELERLGVNMEEAEQDGTSSWFNVSIPIYVLKDNGYKRIHTNSDDPTSSVYTNGTWVINQIACMSGFVSMYKLGPKAKETIDAGKEFDVFNNSLEESYSELELDEDPVPVDLTDRAVMQKIYDAYKAVAQIPPEKSFDEYDKYTYTLWFNHLKDNKCLPEEFAKLVCAESKESAQGDYIVKKHYEDRQEVVEDHSSLIDALNFCLEDELSRDNGHAISIYNDKGCIFEINYAASCEVDIDKCATAEELETIKAYCNDVGLTIKSLTTEASDAGSKRWVQVDLHAEDEYKYCGNGGRSWVTANSEHIDTWATKADAIANGTKTFRKNRKLGRDWDVVCLDDELNSVTESAEKNPKFVVEYDFQNLSKLGEPLITEHIKDILYAKTVAEAEALFAEMIDKSKQYDSAYVSISRPMFLGNSLISTEPYRVYTDGKLIKNIKLTESNNEPEKSQYSDKTKPNSLDVVTETMSDEEYDSATVEFANQLEAKIKKAFPGCEYEEELATQGKWGIDFIYVSLFGHTYEVQFDAAAQEDDIREMGVAKAAEIYAQDAIQNIEKQIIAVANEPDQEVDFNEGNAANFLDEVEAKIRKAATEFLVKNEGIEANEAKDFCTVSADIVGEHIEIAVGAELSYEPLSDLCDALNKVIEEYDKNAYFEPECPGRIVAYLMQYPYLS